jgi:3-methylcrotonyl-CoA carboxylase alpha subunit
MKKFSKILIANRGEIARRIQKTIQRLQIHSVVIYSDPDIDSPFVKEAKEAYPLSGSDAKETYLSFEKILKIAQSSGADAIHPGYGFLSENSSFAREVEKTGIAWIGPSSTAIQAMGDKIESRKKMISIGVPVIPGFHGEHGEDFALLEEAKKIGFPVMIKASAGGGGRGLRKVFSEKDFFSELASARRESMNFFSNDTVFLEKLIVNPRHIEVQVFGDSQGNIVHLYDRDCSIQRRNQKILEEAPAPRISNTTREKMYATAIQAARSIQYTNAGTVEFVMDEKENFYFLEMNTRLQVEHPVTEKITGLDLVELQIRIAEGFSIFESLPEGKVPPSKGSAIELRICAEEGTKPAIGTIHYFSIEGTSRIDSGVEAGNTVSIYYDSMIAKIISYAETRDLCIQESMQNLDQLTLLGVPINDTLLRSILKNPVFQTGIPNTGFFEAHLLDHPEPEVQIPLCLCIASLIHSIRVHDLVGRAFSEIHFQPTIPKKCYVSDSASLQEFTKWILFGKEYSVRKEKDSFCIQCQGEEIFFSLPEHTILEKNIIHFKNSNPIYFARYGAQIFLKIDSMYVSLSLGSESNSSNSKNSNTIQSPMPGKIIALYGKPGDQISEGDPLVSIESMKMENIIRSERNCTIKEIFFQVGDQISSEDTLIVLHN